MSKLIILLAFIIVSAGRQTEKYQCMPCGNQCDKQTFDKEGQCPHCNMRLVKQSSVTFRSISADLVCDYIQKHHDVVLLDVRTKDEFDGKSDDFGTLKNAINIPIQELDKRVEELNGVKDKEIIVYCSHSKRSPRASYLLTQRGFRHVTNMEGGMSTMHEASCKK